MNINRTMAAVMRDPLLAGESIPNMANTAQRVKGEREREIDNIKRLGKIGYYVCRATTNQPSQSAFLHTYILCDQTTKTAHCYVVHATTHR